jgi:DNA-directed RNA polymerase subunit beta
MIKVSYFFPSRDHMCHIFEIRCSQAALDFGSVAIAKQGEKINYTDSEKVTSSVSNNKRVDTNLIIYQHSNNSTCVHQESQVNENLFLKKGQLIADGATTSGVELALGKNVGSARK